MRLKRVLLAGLLGSALACAPVPAAPLAAADPELGAPFTLRPGGSARIASSELTVGFEAVTADSRCPVDVQCIQAGDATVRVWVLASGSREVLEVTTSPRSNPVSVRGYQLTLQALEPAPSTKRTTKTSDYRATLIVTRP